MGLTVRQQMTYVHVPCYMPDLMYLYKTSFELVRTLTKDFNICEHFTLMTVETSCGAISKAAPLRL